MKIQKLSSTDAFLAFDLDDAPGAVGIVRCARKILADGAELLARSTTYGCAAFGIQRGGASAGVNATGDARDKAVAAFMAEVAPLTEQGLVNLDPGKGVEPDELLALADERSELRLEESRGVALQDEVRGVGAVAAAVAAFGDLGGRAVAIEGFDGAGLAVAERAIAEGARVVAVGTASGTVAHDGGIDKAALAEAWKAKGPGLLTELGHEVLPPEAILGAEADLLFCGSRVGLISHETGLPSGLLGVVPTGPVPYTTKALSTHGRAGVTFLPDFVTTGGVLAAWFPESGADVDSIRAAAGESVSARIAELTAAEDPPVLAACRMSESYLATWRETLPFGRPMA